MPQGIGLNAALPADDLGRGVTSVCFSVNTAGMSFSSTSVTMALMVLALASPALLFLYRRQQVHAEAVGEVGKAVVEGDKVIVAAAQLVQHLLTKGGQLIGRCSGVGAVFVCPFRVGLGQTGGDVLHHHCRIAGIHPDVGILFVNVVDASTGISLLDGDAHDDDDGHDDAELEHDHVHEEDPHIWMDPRNAAVMVQNIAAGLAEADPERADEYRANARAAADELTSFRQEMLDKLGGSHYDLITFHDGFADLADSFGMHLLAAVEEEEGSEASAKTIKAIVTLVEENDIPAVFTEKQTEVTPRPRSSAGSAAFRPIPSACA